MAVLALYNFKGGTGKTASAANLAYLSAREGHRTLLWDLDAQGSASFYFQVEERATGLGKKLIKGKRGLELAIRSTLWEGLHILPSDFSDRNLDLTLMETSQPHRRLARRLRRIEDTYDHVFLDCPPNISLLSDAIFLASDAVLVPTIPTPLSIRTLNLLHNHLLQNGPPGLPVLPFFCMVDRRKRLHREARELAADVPLVMLTTEIPYASQVEQMGLRQAPVVHFARSSKPARAYDALWEEINHILKFPTPAAS